MTRPQIIRADTIDLQAHEAPSTQSHHRPNPDGSLAPHQAETLREVAAETAEENHRSPRVSWNPDPADLQQYALALDAATGGQQHGSADTMHAGAQQDALAVAQNGGLSGQEIDEADLDGDAEVDMDDDMMDKISSSPSIEDGGSLFALPVLSSSTPDPLPQSPALRSPSLSPNVCDPRSSSPYLESPDHLPLAGRGQGEGQRGVAPSPFINSSARRHHHHHDGEFEANPTTEDETPSETPNVPEDFNFGASLLWADEGSDNDSVLEYLKNEDGPTRQGSIGLVPKNDNSQKQETDDEFDGDDLTVPYESDDDDGDFSELSDPRCIDSGWGGECLQDTEDIDFDFVYALHTFVATVEGQANATKGDTMVLLDDSNSYWWLVRVVKDSSIGYLPAEHIETPTERLARLNKHRNIDLSASMLGDQQDKARNGIRSAMKRRKAKTVQFAAPTYVDYSDFDYSTEEEDAEGELFAQQQQSQQSAGGPEMEDETAKVKPLKSRSQSKQGQEAGGDTDSSSANITISRVSDEISELRADGPKKSSDGTVRDSFFKDDTVETKKITLTPNLLRDDNAPRASTESREVKQRPSLDKLDKDGIFSKDDKKKKKDKEKDKKPGGLRGFFSRKDKKSKGDDDDDSFGKGSMDADAPDKDIMEEEEAQPSPEKAGPQRNPSKLQKQHPRAEPSPTRRSNSIRENGGDVKGYVPEGRVNNVANVPPASMRLVESSPKASPEGSPRGQRPDRDASPRKSALSKAARPDARPTKSALAKPRVELDDSGSDEELTPEATQQGPAPEEAAQQQQQQQQQAEATQRSLPAADQPAPAPATQPATNAPAVNTPSRAAERLSESPVEVSPISSQNPPPLVVDNSSHEEDRVSPVSTPSPELIEHDEADTPRHKTSTTPSTTRSESWDDASLRAFFDSGSDIRDLLVVVYDKNDVDDVGSDHPVTKSLFREQNAKLAEITTQLDDMLGDWLARKQRLRGTV